ncbi:hypothetical protein IANJMKHF_00247 [Klebsiella phage CPRSA]|nr:hypothetical protein IANJMKHF_00247 [Klebsiella phage CPRSA]
MTFNDLFNGCTGAGAKFNLLKDYPLGSNPGYVMVEVRNGEYYNVFMWDCSFSSAGSVPNTSQITFWSNRNSES